MNLFQLQERLKNFSQDQLVREMRNPTGTAPQYLILSELQRRRRIMQEEQAQMPQQASVAEEAVAAAGMPQGGLAQMAQAMAPQTDMTQNTARMAEGGMTSFPTLDDAGTDKFDEYLIIENIMRDVIPADEALPGGMSDELRDELARRRAIYANRKAEGGEVRRMSEGGLSGVSPRLTDFMPIGPSSRRASGRGIAITPMQMGQDIYEQYIEEMRRLEAERRGSPEGLDLGMTADEVNRRANQGRYDPTDARPPTVGARDIAALAGEEPIDLRGEVEFPTIGAGLSSLLNPAPSRELDNVIDGLVGSGVESRFDPTDELRTYMSPAERSRMMLSDPDIIERAAALDLTPEQYISSLSPARQDAALQAAVNRAVMPRAVEDRMMFGETPIGAIQSERTEELMDETLQRILRNSEAAIARESAIGMTPASTYDEVPFRRAPLAQPDLRDDARAARTAEYIERNLAADAQRMGLDLSGRRAPDFVTEMPSPASATLPVDDARALRTAAYVEENLARDAAGLPERERVGVSDRTMAAAMDGPFDVDLTAQDVLAGADEALSATRGTAAAITGALAERLGAGETADQARDVAREELGAPELLPMDTGPSLEVPEGGIEALLPPLRLDSEEDGGTGGAGGTGGSGAAPEADDLYEQDKWLALAQFGLGLMSSTAPTFGQALGEAGATGIAALRQAREDRQDRITAAQARADRLAAAAARGSTRGMTPDQMADNFRLQASAYRDIAQGILDTSPTGELGDLPEDRQREYLEAISAADVLLRQSVNVSASGIAAAS